MDKLKTCLGNDVCYWAGTDEGKEKTALEIKAQFETFVKTYQKINT